MFHESELSLEGRGGQCDRSSVSLVRTRIFYDNEGVREDTNIHNCGVQPNAAAFNKYVWIFIYKLAAVCC